MSRARCSASLAVRRRTGAHAREALNGPRSERTWTPGHSSVALYTALHVTRWSPIIGNMDAVFRALADPTRRSLLDELFKEDGQTLSALEERLPMTRFGVMKRAGARNCTF